MQTETRRPVSGARSMGHNQKQRYYCRRARLNKSSKKTKIKQHWSRHPRQRNTDETILALFELRFVPVCECFISLAGLGDNMDNKLTPLTDFKKRLNKTIMKLAARNLLLEAYFDCVEYGSINLRVVPRDWEILQCAICGKYNAWTLHESGLEFKTRRPV